MSYQSLSPSSYPGTHILNFKKMHIEPLKFHSGACLESLVVETGPHELWDNIHQTILNCNRFIPKVSLPSKPTPRWFDPSIRHTLNKAHTLRRKIKRNTTPYSIAKLEVLESTLKEMILRAKDSYLSNLAVEFRSNLKKLYRHLADISSSKYSQYPLTQDGVAVNDPLEKATMFNEFFNSTFTTSDYQLPSYQSLQSPDLHLSDIEFTDLEVYELLSPLDPTKAMGPDSIHPLVLKNCADILYIPLLIASLFRLSAGKAWYRNEAAD